MAQPYSFAWKSNAVTTPTGNSNILSQFFLIETTRNSQHHPVMLPWSSRYRVSKRSTASPDQIIFGHHHQPPTLPSKGHEEVQGSVLDTLALFVASLFLSSPLFFSSVSRIDRYSRLLRVLVPSICCRKKKVARLSLNPGVSRLLCSFCFV